MPNSCSECGADDAILRCSRCKQAYYCNVKCQSAHWKSSHKAECKKFEWKPSVVKLKAAYNGNGFVQLQLLQFNGVIAMFELSYKRTFVSCDHQDDSAYRVVPFDTSKVNRKTNQFLLRIPQCINDYDLHLKLRAQMHENQESKEILKWSPFTELSLFIPFDAPLHTFQIGEAVQYLPRDDDLWYTGKIINILPGDIAQLVTLEDKEQENPPDLDVQQTERDKKVFEIPLAELKFTSRQQHHIVQLLEWNEIYNDLLLSTRTAECKTLFSALSAICVDFLQREKLYEAVFVDVAEDFGYFARWLSFEIVDFLFDSNVQNERGIESVNCGLCPERDCHRSLMKCVDAWTSEIAVIRVLQRSHIDVSNWSIAHVQGLCINTMCDICIVEFQHFEYYYSCEFREYNQHAICLCCMHRMVLENQRLLNVLNDLYDTHGLSQDCLAEIVYFVVGWIHCA